MVTHALHVLPSVDRIIVVDDGQIVEEGTYAELIADQSSETGEKGKKGMFKQLIDEYGSLEKTSEDAGNTKALPAAISESGAAPVVAKKALAGDNASKGKAPAQALMTIEDRATGAVTAKTYIGYFKAGGSLAWGPWIITSLLLLQGAQVANNLFLGWWAGESLSGFSNADYMGAYAGLGGSPSDNDIHY